MSEGAGRQLVLLSGGMDSATALSHAAAAAEVVAAVSFDYGSKHNRREIPMARWQAGRHGVPHHVLELDFMPGLFRSHLLEGGGEIPKGHYTEPSMKQTVVPFRNGIMLAVAAGLAESLGADSLVIAAHAGDHAIYPDCRAGFMEAMAEAVRLGTYAGVAIARPFIGLSKAQIVARGSQLGVEFTRTWSCYVGGELHCGECGTCIERREAFVVAGVDDPTSYASEPPLPAAP